MYKQSIAKIDIKEVWEFVGVKLFKSYVMTSHITLEEGKMLDAFITKNYSQLNGEQARIYLLRHLGMPLIVGSKNYKDIILDSGYKVVMEFNLYEEISTIKFQMMG